VFFIHQGMPFRTSHEVVGRAVALCVAKKCQLSDLSLDDFCGINSIFEKDVYDFLGVENAVNKFTSYGSTGSAEVQSQLQFWCTKLKITRAE
jgi:argininosuccinate lyase